MYVHVYMVVDDGGLVAGGPCMRQLGLRTAYLCSWRLWQISLIVQYWTINRNRFDARLIELDYLENPASMYIIIRRMLGSDLSRTIPNTIHDIGTIVPNIRPTFDMTVDATEHYVLWSIWYLSLQFMVMYALFVCSKVV